MLSFYFRAISPRDRIALNFEIAVEDKLTNDLYHGIGLHKIIDFMVKQCQRKFIKLKAAEYVGDKVKWSRLVEFLKVEFKEREVFILHDEVAQSSLGEYKDHSKPSIDNGKDGIKKKPKDTFISTSDNTPQKPVVCFIFDKTVDHVLSYNDDKKNLYRIHSLQDFCRNELPAAGKFAFQKNIL